VLDGHTACVSLRLKDRSKPRLSAEAIKQALSSYVSEAQQLGSPSTPEPSILVMEEPDTSQPRLDRNTQNGYTVSVGRVKEDESGIFDLKFVALSHNSTSSISPSSSQLSPRSCYWSYWLFNIETEAAVLKGYV
jgi:aspartate-semialdehyde dehydrogenase